MHEAVRDASIVIVDDNPLVLKMLRLYLEQGGYRHLVTVQDSTRAMDLMHVSPPDLLLTDVMMPQVTGLDLLREVRGDARLARLPVIVRTSSEETATRLAALELGATDFLTEPVDPTELCLRLRNALVVKAHQDQLSASRGASEGLLRSIFPEAVAERLKRGETVADKFDEATVLFADLVNFTDFASRADAVTVVRQLDTLFGTFDQLVESRGLEKIKTVGDGYMLAGGVPTPRSDHVRAVVEAGIAMLCARDRLEAQGRTRFQLRIGVHTGPVVAGVIGRSKWTWDLWGDTVNVASRMASGSLPGRIQISSATRQALDDTLDLEKRGVMPVKGKGHMRTWFVGEAVG